MLCHRELHSIEISLMQLIWILFPIEFMELGVSCALHFTVTLYSEVNTVHVTVTLQDVNDLWANHMRCLTSSES